MSQSEFIRQAITGTTVRPIITVSPTGDVLLAAVGKLTAAYGRIGNNLNQIARVLNEYHNPYHALVKEFAKKEDVTEKLKAEDGMKWVQAMNNIRNRAAEVVYNDLIFN